MSRQLYICTICRTACIVTLTLASAANAQLTPADSVFAGLSARTRQMAYQAAGGDMSAITPLIVLRPGELMAMVPVEPY